MKWLKAAGFMGVLTAALVLALQPVVWAQQASSTNYQVDEVFFGAGGELNSCSTSYCSKQSAGETGVGNSSSTNYQTYAGFNTDRTPSLTFAVTGGTSDLGVLSTGSTVTTTATFSVKTYLAGGYAVKLASNPPSMTSGTTHTLTALTTPTASSVGTEQFGINLVANTTGCGAPRNFGANPAQIPDSTFSFGAAATGYDTCGLFKYVKGDIIALSSKSSGETDYTMSFLYNISSLTPAGQYTYTGILVATSTF